MTIVRRVISSETFQHPCIIHSFIYDNRNSDKRGKNVLFTAALSEQCRGGGGWPGREVGKPFRRRFCANRKTTTHFTETKLNLDYQMSKEIQLSDLANNKLKTETFYSCDDTDRVELLRIMRETTSACACGNPSWLRGEKAEHFPLFLRLI